MALPTVQSFPSKTDGVKADALFQDLIPSDLAIKFMKTVDKFTLLRASIKEGTLTDPSDIINQCLTLDNKLTEIFANPPPEFRYESVYTSTNADLLYDGCYDIYHDHLFARDWNAMRATRIALNQTIRTHLLDGFNTQAALFTTAENTALFQVCTENIKRLRNDILHTVPTHLGYVNRKPFHHPNHSSHSTPPSEDICITDAENPFLSSPSIAPEKRPPALTRNPDFPAISGYWLLWPLCKYFFLSSPYYLTPT